MKQLTIKDSYLLLKKWWETIDLTNYEKSFLNREIISFNQQPVSYTHLTLPTSAIV